MILKVLYYLIMQNQRMLNKDFGVNSQEVQFLSELKLS